MVNNRNEFKERINFDVSEIKEENINASLIQNEDIKKAYLDAKEKVDNFNKKIEEVETVKLSSEEKKKEFKNLLGLRYIRSIDTIRLRSILKEEPSDRFFQNFYDLHNLDNTINKEIRYYTSILDKENKIFSNPITVTIDINDVVSNPKMNYFYSKNGENCGNNIVEISKQLYSENGKHNMGWYFNELSNYWRINNNSIYWTGCMLWKLGAKFDAIGNGSHLLNTMQIARNSGLTDAQLNLPKGFIECLKNVRVDISSNTPDDLEFVILFNNVTNLLKSKNIDEQFYLKDISKKGVNVIGVEGKDISISTKQQLIDYASSILSKNPNSINSIKEI